MQQFWGVITNCWGNPRINYSIKLLIALCGVVLPAWFSKNNTCIIPLVLGVIASALSETDDNLVGKTKSFVMVFICSTIASITTQVLFNYPILFGSGLFLFSMSFIMLGAIGPRYASIAFSSILLAIYTMIGYATSPSFWFQPIFLLCGIFWYALVALFWEWAWPLYPVRRSISMILSDLGDYLLYKSELFIPIPDYDLHQRRLVATKQNATLVNALNEAQLSLAHRKDCRKKLEYKYLLKTFFLIQDIHERSSSSHLNYEEMSEAFPRSDLLFRFQRIMYLQGKACLTLAQHIISGTTYQHNIRIQRALEEAQKSIQYIQEHDDGRYRAYLPHLDYLLHNLIKINQRLVRLSVDNADINIMLESELATNDATTFRQMWDRVCQHSTLKSPLFRHALRLSLGICLGYAIIQLFHIHNGYWIMLTTLFVCRPSFSSTRMILGQRIIGTIIGLVLGSILLSLFVDLQSQVMLIIVAGVIFFATKNQRYTVATAAITLLVLFCFNQFGLGFNVILPRLGDTLLGCLIAVVNVSVLFPDWASSRQTETICQAIKANQRYLAQIIVQYRIGKRDNLTYRIARREAHMKDAALSTLLSEIESEPLRYRTNLQQNYQFSQFNHTILNYISAMGAHRTQLKNDMDYLLVSQKHTQIHRYLDFLLTLVEDPNHRLEFSDDVFQDPLVTTHTAKILIYQLDTIFQSTYNLHQYLLTQQEKEA